MINLDAIEYYINIQNDFKLPVIPEFNFIINIEKQSTEINYKDVFNVFHYDKKIGSLFLYNKWDKNKGYFSYEKNILYSEYNKSKFNKLLCKYGMDFSGFKYVEISLNTLDPTMLNTIKHIYENQSEYIQKKEQFIHSLCNGKEFTFNDIITSQTNKNNQKVNYKKESIVLYKKTDLDEFPYMVEFYNQNKLPVLDHLYRLECRLKSQFFNDLKNEKLYLDFDDIFDENIQLELMNKAIGNKLIFNIKTSKDWDHNRKRIYKESITIYKPIQNTESKIKTINYIQLENLTPHKSKRKNNIPFLYLSKLFAKNPKNNYLDVIKEIVLIEKIDYLNQINKLISSGHSPSNLQILENYLNNQTKL